MKKTYFHYTYPYFLRISDIFLITMLTDWFLVPEFYLFIIFNFQASRATKLNHLIHRPHWVAVLALCSPHWFCWNTVSTRYTFLFLAISPCCQIQASKTQRFPVFLLLIGHAKPSGVMWHLIHRPHWVAFLALCSPCWSSWHLPVAR